MTEEHRRPAILLSVRFKSALTAEELQRRYRERLPKFQALPGLLQKYYHHDPATGEWGGLYVWDSRESLDAYLASELRKTIAQVYEVVGAPRVEMSEVKDLLRPERA